MLRFNQYIFEARASDEKEPETKFASDIAHENPGLEFDDAQAEKDAVSWIKSKYGDEMYNFKRVKNLEMDAENVKSYSIAVGDNVYSLNLRRFEGDPDTKQDTVIDTLGYDVLPGAIAPEVVVPEIETKPEL